MRQRGRVWAGAWVRMNARSGAVGEPCSSSSSLAPLRAPASCAGRERAELERSLRGQLDAALQRGGELDSESRALREAKLELDARASELSHRLGAAEGSNRCEGAALAELAPGGVGQRAPHELPARAVSGVPTRPPRHSCAPPARPLDLPTER